ncbi:unnamed protein product [Periconia digitata]|uniref:Uncharacterized protein n=1 Tax=Periconia digitata TaxID=1303443 RepID=A0A9W4UJE4_9PLEO|nr:unnamed protein product [Periconia digitata]
MNVRSSSYTKMLRYHRHIHSASASNNSPLRPHKIPATVHPHTSPSQSFASRQTRQNTHPIQPSTVYPKPLMLHLVLSSGERMGMRCTCTRAIDRQKAMHQEGAKQCGVTYNPCLIVSTLGSGQTKRKYSMLFSACLLACLPTLAICSSLLS